MLSGAFLCHVSKIELAKSSCIVREFNGKTPASINREIAS